MDKQIGGWNNTTVDTPSKPSRWKRPAWVAFFLLCTTLSAIGFISPATKPLPKAEPGEEVPFIATEMIVRKDGSLFVTENTRVNLQGKQARHGISRRLASVLKSESGKDTVVKYGDQHATLTLLTNPPLNPTTTFVNTFGDERKFITYRIGDAKKNLRPGTYDFTFQYTAKGTVQKLDGGKSTGFVWDLTGGLMHPIPSAHLRIKLPEFVDPATVVHGSFIGIVKDAESAERASKVTERSPEVAVKFDRSPDEKDVFVTFKVSRPLKPFEQFIIRVAWPPGFLDGQL